MARAGFTTVRDLGSPAVAGIAARDAIREGYFPGPRVLVSGPALSMIGGHADDFGRPQPRTRRSGQCARSDRRCAPGSMNVRANAAQLAAHGVDVIKIMATGGVLDPGAMGLEQHFSDAEMKAIVDTAHSLHLKVAAHAHGARGILAATERVSIRSSMGLSSMMRACAK